MLELKKLTMVVANCIYCWRRRTNSCEASRIIGVTIFTMQLLQSLSTMAMEMVRCGTLKKVGRQVIVKSSDTSSHNGRHSNARETKRYLSRLTRFSNHSFYHRFKNQSALSDQLISQDIYYFRRLGSSKGRQTGTLRRSKRPKTTWTCPNCPPVPSLISCNNCQSWHYRLVFCVCYYWLGLDPFLICREDFRETCKKKFPNNKSFAAIVWKLILQSLLIIISGM